MVMMMMMTNDDDDDNEKGDNFTFADLSEQGFLGVRTNINRKNIG